MRLYTCKEASQLVSQACDRRLTLRERIGLRLHLLICDACARFARQIRFLRTVTQRAAAGGMEDRMPAAMPPAARKRIQDKLQERQKP
jgi:hypothetical protein